jgi:hypothetical protein
MCPVGVDADVVRDGVAVFTEGFGDEGRGVLLVMGQLRVGVKVLVEVEKVWGDGLGVGGGEEGGEE